MRSSLQSATAPQLTGAQGCPASGSPAGRGSPGQASASARPLASRAAGRLPAGAAQAPSSNRVSLSPTAFSLGAALVHSSTAGRPRRPFGPSPGVRTFATGPDTSSTDSDDEKVPPQGAFLMGAKLGDVYLMPRWTLVAVAFQTVNTACCFIGKWPCCQMHAAMHCWISPSAGAMLWNCVPDAHVCFPAWQAPLKVGSASPLGPSLEDAGPMPRQILQRHLLGSTCCATCPGCTLQSLCHHAESFCVQVTRPHHTVSNRGLAERLPSVRCRLAAPATWCAAPRMLGPSSFHKRAAAAGLALQAPAAQQQADAAGLLSAHCKGALCQSRLTLKILLQAFFGGHMCCSQQLLCESTVLHPLSLTLCQSARTLQQCCS